MYGTQNTSPSVDINRFCHCLQFYQNIHFLKQTKNIRDSCLMSYVNCFRVNRLNRNLNCIQIVFTVNFKFL